MPARRKPDNMKAAKPNKKTASVVPPDIEPEIPNPPDWLAGEALNCWMELIPKLDKKRLMDSTFTGGLVAMCQAWSDYVKAISQVKKLGHVIETPNGCLQKNPWLNIQHDAETIFRRWSDRFGLSPHSVGTVKVNAAKPKAEREKL